MRKMTNAIRHRQCLRHIIIAALSSEHINSSRRFDANYQVIPLIRLISFALLLSGQFQWCHID